jgi:hypothetical protein
VNLNSACSNGNKRVFTSVYKGGKWSFNITSDQQCNPVNNKLYGYIVNCLYQTPGNSTYTITSQYYLAYNLPTIWNISYTLLVSPKSYEVVPTPVYQINYSTGSILTLQQPNKTVFTEKGLPAGYRWTVDYNGVSRNSSSNEIYFYSIGTHSFTVPVLRNSSVTPDCNTRYTPTPGSGQATSGVIAHIQFSSNTTCYSYFTESGLPASNKLSWYVVYNGTNESAPASSNSVKFIIEHSGAYIGNYSFSVGDVNSSAASCAAAYVPTPSSGHLLEGENQSITFSLQSEVCTTTFDETGLPFGTKWYVDFNGTTENSTSNTIVFKTGTGTYPFSVSNILIQISNFGADIGSCEYKPIPSSGNIPAGSTTEKINFQKSCIYQFTYVSGGTSEGSTLTLHLDNLTKGDVILVADTINHRNASISDSFGDSFSTVVSNSSSKPEYYLWSATALSGGNDTITIKYPGAAYSYATAVGLQGYYLSTLKHYTSTSACSVNKFTPASGDFVFGICHSESATSVKNTTGFYSLPPSEPFASSEFSFSWTGGATTVPFSVTSGSSTAEVVFTISNTLPSPPPKYSVTFYESGLPAPFTWSVTYNGVSDKSSTSPITISTSSSGSHTYTANDGFHDYCSGGKVYKKVYAPSPPASGSLTAPGGSTTIKYVYSTTGPTKLTC